MAGSVLGWSLGVDMADQRGWFRGWYGQSICLWGCVWVVIVDVLGVCVWVSSVRFNLPPPWCDTTISTTAMSTTFSMSSSDLSPLFCLDESGFRSIHEANICRRVFLISLVVPAISMYKSVSVSCLYSSRLLGLARLDFEIRCRSCHDFRK